MTSSTLHWTLASAALPLLLACGGSPASPDTPPQPRTVEEVSSRWSYHPARPRGLTVRIDLEDTTRLFAGRAGERWLVNIRKGSAETAPLLADEHIVAISQPNPSTFLFVGSGGTVYTSASPLGPFTTIRRMDPAPLRVAVAGNNIVAILWDGTVVRSTDEGKTFSPVVADVSHPYDLALAPDGRGMILGFPERLWISSDTQTWSPAATPAVGAGFVGLDASGGLVARGVQQSVVWSAERESPNVSDRTFEPASMDLWTDLEIGPSASALITGRAMISDGSYMEVAQPVEGGPWYLGRSAMTERLRWTEIPESQDCKYMALGVRGQRIALGCMAGARKGGVYFPSLRLIRSGNGGQTFTKHQTGLVSDEGSTFLVPLDDDTVVVSGACKPRDNGICMPGAPIRLRPVGGSRTLQYESSEPSKVPSILGRVGRLVFGNGNLYSVVWLQGTKGAALLVSSDGGETFRTIPLNLSGTEGAKKLGSENVIGPMQPGKLEVGEDGTLSWVMHSTQGPVWILMDRTGRVLSANLGPDDDSFIEAAGRRGIAFGKKDGSVLESLNGGATFEVLTHIPVSFWGGDPAAWCQVDGCVFGESFSRAGWTNRSGGVVAKEPSEEQGQSPTFRTPILCEVIETGGVIENVTDWPEASDALRGSVDWSVLSVDRKKASVSSVHATAEPRHGVRWVSLLPPVSNPDRTALEARPQVEGAAALRYVFQAETDGKPIVGSPLRRVEVAWDNQFEGPPQRAVLVDGGSLRANDVSILSAGSSAQANVGVLSVAPGGIHVCPHADCNEPQDRISFFRGRGPVESIPVVPWPKRGLGGSHLPLSHHWMHIDGKHVALGIHHHRSLLMRADRQDDGSHQFSALALAPVEAKGLGIFELLRWSYRYPNRMGIAQTLYRTDEAWARAWVLRFDWNQGAFQVEPAPTQLDLADPPLSCTEAQRQGSYRVTSPSLSGSQHPVIIEQGGKRGLMHTSLAVLHGSPASACAEVFDARSEKTKDRRALIPMGAMERSWLLWRESESTLRWWGMRCRFEPGAKLDEKEASFPTLSTRTENPTGSATDADCTELYKKIVNLSGIPLGGANHGQDAFISACRGKPIDMDCVRRATDSQQMLGKCIQL